MKHEAQTESKCGIAVDNDSEKAAAAIAGRWLLLVKINSFFFNFKVPNRPIEGGGFKFATPNILNQTLHANLSGLLSPCCL